MKVILMTLLVGAVILITGQYVSAVVYEVGPDKTYARIIDCPTHNLSAGDIIKVYYKSSPYREKFLLHGRGTAQNPVQLIGIPDAAGNKPVIDGENAISSNAVSYWNEDRQLILVGQNNPYLSDYIIVEGFVLRNANGKNTFTDDHGLIQSFSSNACGIRTEYASNVTVRDCEMYNNGNGIFNGSGTITAPQNLVVESCYIHDNGVVTPDDYHHHNVYMGVGGPGSRATFQGCRFGEMANDGQQCKFRVETLIFRYNWVEGGRNSQLDIVESTANGQSDAYVYGNVIIKPALTHNARLVHFGGDQSGSVRNGTLYFFNNTCIIHSESTTTSLFQISRDGANVVADNNIFYKTTDHTHTLKVWRDRGNITGSNNWLSQGTTLAEGLTGSITATNPGFKNETSQDYRISAASSCIDAAGDYSPPSRHALVFRYIKHLLLGARLTRGGLDLGAFEFSTTQGVETPDFNADGHVDILWRNSNTGENGVWYMNGTSRIGFSYLNSLGDINWECAATGDFNGDGSPDMLWRHKITGHNGVWFMKNNKRIGQAFINPLTKTDWICAGTADFNNDGNTDIMWRNQVTGQNGVWLMNGIKRTDIALINQLPNIDWACVGLGDFNGDGKVDILWRHKATGQNGVWFMNGTVRTGYVYLKPLSNLDWECAGLGDFNSDGKPDILWRHKVNGQNAVWFMEGTTRSGNMFLNGLSVTDWKIVN